MRPKVQPACDAHWDTAIDLWYRRLVEVTQSLQDGGAPRPHPIPPHAPITEMRIDSGFNMLYRCELGVCCSKQVYKRSRSNIYICSWVQEIGCRAHQDSQGLLILPALRVALRGGGALRNAHQRRHHAFEQIRSLQIAVIVDEKIHQQLPVCALSLQALQHY